jgi:A/G-specific adenine glycosylase
MKSRPFLNTTDAKRFQRLLLRWYRKKGRSLPWRVNPTAYRVWISEIMLQQTQVKTVIPYFNRFIRQFPDVESLARASESRVVEFWAGLGYYSRARNLHKAARQIVKIHGSFPWDFKAILALPGIGRYTAGAISSIAFNQKQPVVDGNIRRVLVRLNGEKRQMTDSHHWKQMSDLLPDERISLFNQAMMELGALICVPFQPQCRQCPVTDFCKARRLEIQNSIPASRSTQALKHTDIAILVLNRNGRILLTSEHKPSFIPGKWGLPCTLVSKGGSAEKAASLLCSNILGSAVPLSPVIPVRHSITRYQIHACGFCGEVDGTIRGLRTADSIRWISPDSNRRFLTSSLFQKVLKKARKTKLR